MNNTRTTDPDTAADLIDAARAIFARHGYHGASVRAITAAAGANLGAITYHFGSKRELYDRVVGSVVAPLAERVERACAEGGSVLARAGRVVEAYFDYLGANPDLPPLMMQELMLGGAPPAAVLGPMRRALAALTALIREGQASGEVRAGPTQVMSIFILSVPVHLSMVRGLLGSAGVDLSDPVLRDQVVAAARSFVESGLRGDGVGPGGEVR
ncbi:MAG TPA: TetR/AcrR family transcriptional regulator [Longimicrobiales bacterium]